MHVWAAMLLRGLFIALALMLSSPAHANSASEAAHRLGMEKLQESAYADLHNKFRPLVESDEEWDRLVSVVLETWHVAYFTATGTVDNREADNQMPWVSPGPICADDP